MEIQRRNLRSTLVLVSVTDDTGIPRFNELEQRIKNAERSLHFERGRLNANHPDLTVEISARTGPVLDVLKSLSTLDSLVVVGTAPRDGNTLRFIWSLGARLAADAVGPVAIIPSSMTTTTSERHGVTVGIDGTPAAIEALRYAATAATELSEELVAVHAWDEPVVWMDGGYDQTFLDHLEELHAEILRDSLAEVADIGGSTAPKPVGRLVHGAAPVVLGYEARNTALLVLGSHGRRGMVRSLLGSVSHSMILRIQTPTIVVKEPPR